jgi:hypothetical protein
VNAFSQSRDGASFIHELPDSHICPYSSSLAHENHPNDNTVLSWILLARLFSSGGAVAVILLLAVILSSP